MTSTGALKLFDVRDTPLSVDEVIQAVADPQAGGVAVFIGMVRNHDGEQGRPEHHGDHPGHDLPNHDHSGHRADGRDDHREATRFGVHSGEPVTLGEPTIPAIPGEPTIPLVTGLEYVAHPTALAILHETAEKVLAEHPVTALAAVHRTGELAVGDLAVVCAASSAHRAEAFAACRALIDALKAQVPIWKREQFEDGSHIWVGC